MFNQTLYGRQLYNNPKTIHEGVSSLNTKTDVNTKSAVIPSISAYIEGNTTLNSGKFILRKVKVTLTSNSILKTESIVITNFRVSLQGNSTLNSSSELIKEIKEASTNLIGIAKTQGSSSLLMIDTTNIGVSSKLNGGKPFLHSWIYEDKKENDWYSNEPPNTSWEYETIPENEWEYETISSTEDWEYKTIPKSNWRRVIQ